MNEQLRAWIYRVVTAVLAVGAIYGFINAEQSAAITSLVGALTGLLAALNTSTSAPPAGGDE